jgi:hypothetical protein
MLCRECLEELEYSFSRKRIMRHTAEDGPVAETITVAVGHCLKDGRYSTIFPDDIVKNKQYCISDIRSVLENKVDFSLASPRTRAYWRSWFKGVWDAVIRHIQLCIGCILSENDISIALYSFGKECGQEWLRYVLDIFSTGFNNLCMFLDIISATIGTGSEKMHKLHGDEGADAPWRGIKPP